MVRYLPYLPSMTQIYPKHSQPCLILANPLQQLPILCFSANKWLLSIHTSIRRQGCGSALSGTGSSIFPNRGSGSSSESRVLMNKNWKKITAVKLFYIFWIEIAIHLSLGLHKKRKSYRSLQPSKENIQHFKTWKFFPFFYIWWSFCPPGSGSESSKSN